MKKPAYLLIPPLLVFLLVSSLYLGGALERLELMTIDLRYRVSPAGEGHGRTPVAVVTLDQNSLKGLNSWPIERKEYLNVLRNVVDDGALGVLVDLIFSSPGRVPSQDRQLAEAMEHLGNIVLAVQMEERTTEGGVVIRSLSLPVPALRKAARALGSITFEVDMDGLVRRMPPVIDSVDEAYLPLGVVGALMLDPLSQGRYPPGGMIDMSILRSGSLTTVPFLEASRGVFPRGTFRDRIVLLGATSTELHDFWLTPAGVVPGVFIQTAVLDTVLRGAWYERQGRGVTLVLILLLCALTAWLMGRKGWKRGLAVLILVTGCVMALAAAAASARLFVQATPLLLVGPLMYPVQLAMRGRITDQALAQEKRKTDALLSLSDLRTAEETGHESHLVPFVVLGNLIGSEGMTVCLGGETAGNLECLEVRGFRNPHPPEGLVHDVLDRGECITVQAAEGRVGVLVPMATARKVMGVLYVEFAPGRSPGEGEVRLLLSFATQTAYFLENRDLDMRVKDLYINTIRAITRALDSKDQYTSAHAELTLDHLDGFGRYCGLDREQIEALHAGALLHDIGKIGVPDSILTKKGSLSEEEYRVMQNHPVTGEDIVRGLPFPEDVKKIIRHHHEHFDGTGYPDGLRGEQIPYLVRIFSILDAYEAMVGVRSYRTAVDSGRALESIREEAGTHFDPELVRLFLRYMGSLDHDRKNAPG